MYVFPSFVTDMSVFAEPHDANADRIRHATSAAAKSLKIKLPFFMFILLKMFICAKNRRKPIFTFYIIQCNTEKIYTFFDFICI